jgi:hypothetical protein
VNGTESNLVRLTQEPWWVKENVSMGHAAPPGFGVMANDVAKAKEYGWAFWEVCIVAVSDLEIAEFICKAANERIARGWR